LPCRGSERPSFYFEQRFGNRNVSLRPGGLNGYISQPITQIGQIKGDFISIPTSLQRCFGLSAQDGYERECSTIFHVVIAAQGDLGIHLLMFTIGMTW
jgi:hypothetical protein